MDAIICSAGKGSRLGPLGFFMRKSMFRDPHTDKSILWYQLDALQEMGVENVVILHPRGDFQIPAEVKRLADRYSGMNFCCVPVSTRNICETVAIGLAHTRSDRIVRLDGDVCVPERTGLMNLKNVEGNALAYFKPTEDIQVNERTVIIKNGGCLDFWRPGDDCAKIWCCIEIWNQQDLHRLVEGIPETDQPHFYQRVNACSAESSPLVWKPVEVPVTYEIDTPEDIRLLMDFWDRRAKDLEKRALDFWVNQQAYPSFSVNKTEQLRVDVEIIADLVQGGQKLVEIGAGEGILMGELLRRRFPARYRVIEPNPFWISRIREQYGDNPAVFTYQGTLEEWNQHQSEQDDVDDVALALGWAIYIIHDETLHRNLFGLKARKLILKASEPPQDRFSRLLVDNYSPDIGGHYIALYRSVTEMCGILRHAGWLIKEIRRNIYPAEIESRYGNRSYLIVAERP